MAAGTAVIVTDVGASMISGWGSLIDAEYDFDYNIIELIFD